jgi:hypothetical protein
MYTITIECPTTLARVSVDVVSKSGPPDEAYPDTVLCPSCGKMHHWRPLQVLAWFRPRLRFQIAPRGRKESLADAADSEGEKNGQEEAPPFQAGLLVLV